jgi:Histidine kinase-, DNA gyrase B-, and HSP90-like ATPase
MPAERAGLERAGAVESWIARVRLVAVVFAALEVGWSARTTPDVRRSWRWPVAGPIRSFRPGRRGPFEGRSSTGFSKASWSIAPRCRQGAIPRNRSCERGQQCRARLGRDDGPGIPIDDQKLIFEKFGRSAVGGAKPGTGLGLFIARSIAEAHGGSVEVDSAPNRGSVFTLELPLAQD